MSQVSIIVVILFFSFFPLVLYLLLLFAGFDKLHKQLLGLKDDWKPFINTLANPSELFETLEIHADALMGEICLAPAKLRAVFGTVIPTNTTASGPTDKVVDEPSSSDTPLIYEIAKFTKTNGITKSFH